MAFGFNFGSDKSKERVWRPQGDALRGLYDQSAGLGQQGAQQIQNAAQPYSGQAQNFTNVLQGQAQGQGAVLGGLEQQAAGNPGLVQSQIDVLSQNLGQFYQQQLNPGIQQNAIGASGLGGGRQGVAQGVALGQLGNNLQSGITGILGQQQGLQQNAANSYLGATQGAAQAGIEGIGQAQQQAVNPYLQSLAPWLAQADIYGTSPGTLNSSKGFRFGATPQAQNVYR